MVFVSLTLLKTFAMTKRDRVGRIVPAERTDSLLITLFSSFNELPTHGGAEGPVFPVCRQVFTKELTYAGRGMKGRVC